MELPDGAAEAGIQRDRTGKKSEITEQQSCGFSPGLETGILECQKQKMVRETSDIIIAESPQKDKNPWHT